MTTLPPENEFPKAGRWVPAERTETCSFCGVDNLAWLKSKKGKSYLAKTKIFPEVGRVAHTQAFHACSEYMTSKASAHLPETTDVRLDALENAARQILKIVGELKHAKSV